MRVLALDVATRTGWCVLSDASGEWELDGIGTIDVSPAKDEPEGVRYQRFARAFFEVDYLHGPFDAVAIEQPFSNRMRTAQILAGLTAVALVQLEDDSVPYVFVSPGTWKKHLGIPGNSKKPGVRRALNGRLGLNPGSPLTEDEADAVGIGLWLIDTALARGGDDSEEAA